jgi:hypothetical protein
MITHLDVTVLVGGIWTYKVEMEHKAHIEHERHENGGQLPEAPAYDHMNRRVKPFPWGQNALFFNPEVCFRFHSCHSRWFELIFSAGEQGHERRLDYIRFVDLRVRMHTFIFLLHSYWMTLCRQSVRAGSG